MMVLDKANEMLNMGFKEDMKAILLDVSEQRQIVLFSATVPEEILAITQQFQQNPVLIEINRDQVTLDNIVQTSVEVPMCRRPEAVMLLLHYYQPHRAIIFANTKSMVDDLTESLSATGFSVEGLHGDTKRLQRTKVMNDFKKGKVKILVATDVAARGIDVSDVDCVFNFDIPKVADYYVNRIGRIGRTGRTGKAGKAASFGEEEQRVRVHRATAELVIDAGSANQVGAGHIVGAITKRAGLSPHELAKVESPTRKKAGGSRAKAPIHRPYKPYAKNFGNH